MDQSFNELQRYCTSQPDDLAAGERLFNHYLRLNDPYFLKTQSFLQSGSDIHDFRIFLRQFHEWVRHPAWPWLSTLLVSKSDHWSDELQFIDYSRLRMVHSRIREQLSPFIKKLKHRFSEDLNSLALFVKLISQFKYARNFKLDLVDIDYSGLAKCLPESLEHLWLKSTLLAAQSFLNELNSKTIRELTIEGEDGQRIKKKASTHWSEVDSWNHHSSYPQYEESKPLSIPESLRCSIQSLSLLGDRCFSSLAIESLFEESWPQLRSLALRHVHFDGFPLTNVLNPKTLPQLKSFFLRHSHSSQSDYFIPKGKSIDQIKINDLRISGQVTVNQLRALLTPLNLKHADIHYESTEDADNHQLALLFRESTLLEAEKIYIEVPQFSDSQNYAWLSGLESEELKELQIVQNNHLALRKKERHQLTDLASDLSQSVQFPNLENCLLVIYRAAY